MLKKFRLVALVVFLTNPAFAQSMERIPERPTRMETPTMPTMPTSPSPMVTIAPSAAGGGPAASEQQPALACQYECERDREKCPNREYRPACPIGDGCFVCK